MSLGWNELILLGITACFLVPFILFLLMQQSLLKNIQPHNRTISPGEIFLQLIPLFGMIWQFVVVSRISNSIHNELSNQQRFSFEATVPNPIPESSHRPAYAIGIAYCVLLCCSIIPMLGALAGFAGLICWIIYWVKLAEYKSLLQQRHLILNANNL
jgi:hypothetical protein